MSPGDAANGRSKSPGAPARRPDSKNRFDHEWALGFATCHFALSLAIFVVCLLYFAGTAMSDAYHPAPSWINALFALLWVLQAPASAIETAALRHSEHGGNWLWVGVLGVLWSLFLGYFLPFLIRSFRNAHQRNRPHEADH